MTVFVDNKNDAPLIASQKKVISENSAEGSLVDQAVVADDEDALDTLQFSIVNPNCWQHVTEFSDDKFMFPGLIAGGSEVERKIISGAYANIFLKLSDTSQVVAALKSGADMSLQVLHASEQSDLQICKFTNLRLFQRIQSVLALHLETL